jgi:hypothetical protein
MREVPRQTVYSVDNGRTLMMHPDVARELERQISRRMEEMTDRAIMRGTL